MLKKQNIGINPHVANNSSRDQSLTGIGGPRVTLNEDEKLSPLNDSVTSHTRSQLFGLMATRLPGVSGLMAVLL